MLQVIGLKILGVRDFQIHCSSSSPSRIDLGTSKSKVKFSNGFSLDPRIVKKMFFLLPLDRIWRLRIVLHAPI